MKEVVSRPEVRAKMRAAAMGNTKGRGNKGKVQSEAQKAAHSERMTGRIHSSATKAKMSVAQKAAWERKTPEQIADWLERKQVASFKPTNIERWLHELLDELEVVFVIHPWVRVTYGGVRRVLRPDVLVPDRALIIEMQGCYWHGCTACYGERARTDRVVEDQMRRLLMEEQGYTVVEIFEHDIKSGAADALLRALPGVA